MQCAYCDCTTPTQRFKTIKHKGAMLFLCTDGEENCFLKWKQLQKAKAISLKIMNLAKCELGMCEKEIKHTFRIEKMRDIIARMMGNIEKSAKKILRKSIASIKKLLYHLKIVAEIVGLENQYRQIKLRFI